MKININFLKEKAASIKRAFRIAIAALRWSKKIVCEESRRMGVVDFHAVEDSGRKASDYSDGDEGPVHCYYITCRRCGKKFII